MLVLERKGNDVFCDGKKLTIVAQATKGPGKEVVKIDGLEGSNGQKWVSLSRLVEGINEIETNARQVTNKYELTQEEQNEINSLQARIDEIINNAKTRIVTKPKLDFNPAAMTEAERLAKIEELKRYYGF